MSAPSATGGCPAGGAGRGEPLPLPLARSMRRPDPDPPVPSKERECHDLTQCEGATSRVCAARPRHFSARPRPGHQVTKRAGTRAFVGGRGLPAWQNRGRKHAMLAAHSPALCDSESVAAGEAADSCRSHREAGETKTRPRSAANVCALCPPRCFCAYFRLFDRRDGALP